MVASRAEANKLAGTASRLICSLVLFSCFPFSILRLVLYRHTPLCCVLLHLDNRRRSLSLCLCAHVSVVESIQTATINSPVLITKAMPIRMRTRLLMLSSEETNRMDQTNLLDLYVHLGSRRLSLANSF